MIKLVIIGFGSQGSMYGDALLNADWCDRFLLTAASIRNTKRLELLKRNFPNLNFYTDALEMLDQEKPDAAVICVPHFEHPFYVKECLKRKIHVLCEKPAGIYASEVEEMISESLKQPDTVFALMFNQRTNPLYLELKKIVKEKRYGNVRRINWTITNWYRPQKYYDDSSWRGTWKYEGGGLLVNQAVHQLDLLQWIFGMPAKVHSVLQYGLWHDIETEDDVNIIFEYADGHTASFISSTGDPIGVNRLEIQFDRAYLKIEEDQLLIRELNMPENEWYRMHEAFAKMPYTEHLHSFSQKEPQHKLIFNNFADAILENKGLIADGRDSLNAVLLNNAIYLSAFLNKEITVPCDENLFETEMQKRMK